MSYLVKVGGEYLSTGNCPGIWTTKQRDAYRFTHWEQAFDCAEAWRSGSGSRDARVVRLAKRANR